MCRKVANLSRRRMACRILDLSACRGISAASLQSALPQLKQLEVLHLDGNPEVGPSHCMHVFCGTVWTRTFLFCRASVVTDLADKPC